MSQIITCKDCGKEFELTDSEVEFFTDVGRDGTQMSLPKRCKECRLKKKQRNEGRDGGFRRQDSFSRRDRSFSRDNDRGY